jgi:Outer membrane protein beta-barrel domain
MICGVISKISMAQVLIALVFGDKLTTDKLEFGLSVSPALTNITDVQSKVRPGLDLGLYFNVKISDNFFLHPEAIPKSAFGAKGIPPYPTGNGALDTFFAGGSVQRSIKAISLPLLVRYRIHRLLFVEAGPQIDWLLKVKDVFKAKTDGNDLNYTIDVKDQYTHFAFGVAGGLLYKLKKDKGMGIGIRYCYGLTDIMKTAAGAQKNTAWLLKIDIPIGAGGSGKQAAKTTPAK